MWKGSDVNGTGPSGGCIEHDGLEIAYLDWRTAAGATHHEPLVVLHPTGFCAGVFDPLVPLVGGTFEVIGVDLRGHGASQTVIAVDQLGNDQMALDVLAVVDHLGIDRFCLLGVSLGGGIAIEVAAAAPGRVASMMLCEAIAIDSGTREAHHFAYEGGEHPLAVAARRRRPVWPDRTTVVESYGSRPPLSILAPEVLDAYVRWGFVDTPDGQVELACAPDTEANIFGSAERHGPTSTFERLADVTCPASVLAGTDTNLERQWFEAQARLLDTELVLVDGSHFFLFEDLDRGASLILKHLG